MVRRDSTQEFPRLRCCAVEKRSGRVLASADEKEALGAISYAALAAQSCVGRRCRY
jgi:hypothetical protein